VLWLCILFLERSNLPEPQDTKDDRIKRVTELLSGLKESQIGWLEEIAQQLNRPHTFWRNDTSDLVSECLLEEIGDGLRLHHCFSKESFTKDKFEYLMERAVNLCGGKAKLAAKGNPGHDITINEVKFSLKTQANKGINRKGIHISKFMELGKGQWSDKDEDLEGLRKQFFAHMRSYDRILILRTLSKAPADWEYELVEVPKTLLEKAKEGTLQMNHDSAQMPKPGNCFVMGKHGISLFTLYFDGGTERKLQIKAINISTCMVHAQWKFPSEELVEEG
jgi:restriction endonuclease SmaI-like protein